MTVFTKLEGPALEAYRRMTDELVRKATTELKLPATEIVVRDLRPEDVGLTNPDWTFNVASGGAWNTLIDNKTIADNRFVGINGFMVAESGEQAVTQLKITRMGQTKRYWQIQGTNFLEDQTIWFTDPITIDQNTTLTVSGYAPSGTTDSVFRLIFMGAVAEKRGVLVS